MIRFIIFLALEVNAGAQTTAGKLWIELSAKRATLPALRQEFEVTQVTSRQSHISTWKRRELLDMSNGQWRVNIFGGLGNSIRIFDGQNLYYLEDGSPEYIHSKLHPKAVIPLPLPAPYSSIRGDWSKAVEVSRQPCGNSGQGNQCVVLDVPIRHWERDPTGNYKKLLEGKGRLMLDLELGVLLSMKTVELIEERNGNYQIETTYKLNSMSIGLPVDPNLFKLPSSATTEVKELPDWDAARIKRLLGGKPAPELTVNDIRGNTLSISEFKGKTVLLAFCNTWTTACLSDWSVVEKITSKHVKNLKVVGIVVHTDRVTVERHLLQHPRRFPVVLSTENEMPRPYQFNVTPLYIVIDRNGNIAAAMQRSQGLADLTGALKKAGLEPE